MWPAGAPASAGASDLQSRIRAADPSPAAVIVRAIGSAATQQHLHASAPGATDVLTSGADDTWRQGQEAGARWVGERPGRRLRQVLASYSTSRPLFATLAGPLPGPVSRATRTPPRRTASRRGSSLTRSAWDGAQRCRGRVQARAGLSRRLASPVPHAPVRPDRPSPRVTVEPRRRMSAPAPTREGLGLDPVGKLGPLDGLLLGFGTGPSGTA
jgi:hypothetical protein